MFLVLNSWVLYGFLQEVAAPLLIGGELQLLLVRLHGGVAGGR